MLALRSENNSNYSNKKPSFENEDEEMIIARDSLENEENKHANEKKAALHNIYNKKVATQHKFDVQLNTFEDQNVKNSS